MTVVIFYAFNDSSSEVYIGVEFLYTGNMNVCKELVNKTKNYTNLIVVGLSKDMQICFNSTLLDQVCDYLYEQGINFIVQLTSPIKFSYDIIGWITTAMQKYSPRFLGIYYFDEPGGRQLDDVFTRFVSEAESWDDVAEKYIFYLHIHLKPYLQTGAKLFTADYALYWFDYKAGYDVIMCEFGWNHTREIQVALCRGAAKAQRKEWGVMLTWTYVTPPHLASADELYDDLILAYHAGAKYFVIFEYETMSDEHFKVLENFWKYVKLNPNRHGVYRGDIAYLVPKNFGFGFRAYNDTIWGLWRNGLTDKIWNDVVKIVKKYGCRLDIIYEGGIVMNTHSKYNQVFRWNKVLTVN